MYKMRWVLGRFEYRTQKKLMVTLAFYCFLRENAASSGYMCR